ncbi:MAG: DUF58 domain-containing protein [Planctomycetota bacterium]|nr:DUF58 domain-containing protein [Planctomycetota bacterium]
MAAAPTFDPGFLRRLERLAVVARRTLRGAGLGERRSKRQGGAVEFADYRGYSPGDDTRRIDWYAYARLETLLLKLYVEEQDLALHVLVDQSASMGTGADPATGRPSKLDYARHVAAALAYVGLSAGDRVTVRAFRGGELSPQLGPLRGRDAFLRLLRFLGDDREAAGRTSLGDAARTFVARRPTTGVVIVVTDLLDPQGHEEPLRRLRGAGHEPFVLHVVSPDEAEPEVGVDVDLEDAETGEVLSVAMDQAAVRAYREAHARFLAEVAAFCRRAELGYALARTDVPFEELVLGVLRRGALVR